MGLDQYAYVAARANERSEFYENEGEFVNGEWVVPGKSKPRDIAYWRKHPNLHGWMEKLAERKNLKYDLLYDSFNGIELELTWEDLDELERTVTHKQLPSTSGFFFGDEKDEHYYDSDLAFIRNAKAELFLGLKVFYNSSW
jgi:hypothetical protein